MTSPPTTLQNESFTLSGSAEHHVLLVHGLGGGPYELQWLGEHLHAHAGYTVRGMHLAGHERRARWMPRSTHEQWLASLAAEYEALARGAGVVHVVGFSTGCLVALRWAQERGLTGRLVLLAPFVDVYRPRFLPVRPEKLLEWLPRVSQVPRPPPPLRDRSLRAEVSRLLPFLTMNLDAVRSAKALGAQVLSDLERVTVPTLLLQGARDTVVDPAGAQQLDRGLRCEHELVVLPDSNHLLAVDRERSRVFSEVQRFLSAHT